MRYLRTIIIACTLITLPGVFPCLVAAGEFTGAVIGPLAENDGYYVRLSGEQFKYKNWEEARVYAESLFIKKNGRVYKGFLFTPNTPTENGYVVNRLKPNEDWIGLFQGPKPKFPADNWWYLNNRKVTWTNWGSGEPDDQKNGAWTRCRLLSYFNGVTFTSDGDTISFGVSTNSNLETGCENFGMLRADGKWKDKEGKSHGNGFIIEFRAL